MHILLIGSTVNNRLYNEIVGTCNITAIENDYDSENLWLIEGESTEYVNREISVQVKGQEFAAIVIDLTENALERLSVLSIVRRYCKVGPIYAMLPAAINSPWVEEAFTKVFRMSREVRASLWILEQNIADKARIEKFDREAEIRADKVRQRRNPLYWLWGNLWEITSVLTALFLVLIAGFALLGEFFGAGFLLLVLFVVQALIIPQGSRRRKLMSTDQSQ